MQRRRSPRFYAFDIYRLPVDQREAAYEDVPAELLSLVRYYVEVYFPPLKRFRRNADEARARRLAQESRHAAHHARHP